ncbi:molybdopterin-containing oxidoreductase family protein [Slackia heliotrinireducens]|uniref:molybdopterin-containing oxidoreductase family protein n=1 Tax=Slackia heliotrinireducens TaxID=84110 RepID=UPI0033153BCB
MERSHLSTLSRRGFMKGSALASLGLGVGLSGLTGCAPTEAPKADQPAAETTDAATSGYQYEPETSEGEWIHTACQRNCFDTCMILAKVVDGTLVKVKGDPDNPYTAGGLCVKTQSYVDWTYSEERILYPLRRTGKKGPGCTFERISWDDAIEEITTKWKDIIDQYGGEAITWSRYQGNQGSLNRRVLEPLFFKMGATYCEGSMCNNGYVHSLPYTTAGVPVMRAEAIAEKSLYISWAHNPAATSLHTMKFIKEMNKNGGKIVVINPVATVETMWADVFVQLKAGTDVAFALGIGKYLLDNDMYDAEWIEQWAQGLDDYKAECDEWPADRVAEVCGVPAEQVAQVAELLWENRENACLKTGLCLGRRLNGGMSHISIKCLSGLVGHPEMYFNMTSSGGLQLFSNGAPAMQDTMFEGKLPSEAEPVGTVRNYSSPDLGKVLTSQNYGEDHNFADNPIRSIMFFGNNAMVSHPNLNLVKEGLMREDLFTVVHDLFMTDTCDYADIILPAPTNFEYEEFNGGYGHNYAVHNQPVIETMGECVANWDLCNRLGQAMGYDDEAFNRDEQWFRDLFMTDKPFTYEEFVEKGWIDCEPKTFDEAVYNGEGFKTPSGKFQFASDELEHDHGTRAPHYVDDPESLQGDPELLAKYPLALISASAKEYLNGMFGNMPDNNLLFEENYLYIDAEEAEERGIADGDEVIVRNDRGELHRIARVLENRIAEHTVYTYPSTWDKFANYQTVNFLTTDARADIGRGVSFQSCLVEVEKA